MRHNEENRPFVILEETGSTNDDLETLVDSRIITRENLREFDGYTELAFRQTGGRGRFERKWDSSYGGLYQSSLIFMELSAFPGFTHLIISAALAARKTICDFVGIGHDVAIKWPNDISLDGGKACGMLIKAMSGSIGTPVIIGTGINVFNEIDEAALRGSAILRPATIAGATGRVLQKSHIMELSAALLENFNLYSNMCASSESASLFEEYNENLMYAGRRVLLHGRVEDGGCIARGEFMGIDPNGFIIIADEISGENKIFPSGEISPA